MYKSIYKYIQSSHTKHSPGKKPKHNNNRKLRWICDFQISNCRHSCFFPVDILPDRKKTNGRACVLFKSWSPTPRCSIKRVPVSSKDVKTRPPTDSNCTEEKSVADPFECVFSNFALVLDKLASPMVNGRASQIDYVVFRNGWLIFI